MSLTIPPYQPDTSQRSGKTYVFDPIRKRHYILTPEEHVRQSVVHYLVHSLNYPRSLMAIEYPITVNELWKRCDIVCFNRDGKPWLIVECKAPSVKLDQSTLDQAARYNLSLHVQFMMISNGAATYLFELDYLNEKWHSLDNFPEFDYA